jgi:hypothetical protein
MNTRPTILLIATAAAALAADPEVKPAPRPRLPEATLRQAFGLLPDTHVRTPSVAAGEVSQDMTQYPSVGADHGMVGRVNGPSPLSRPFDLREGGTFERIDGKLLSRETMLQYDAPNAGWDLFRLSW